LEVARLVVPAKEMDAIVVSRSKMIFYLLPGS
jgi:hypothetical protein